VSLASPRRSGSSLGSSSPVLEDWGVAFEGLPLDARLYPAIGLYQRDDKVTLLAAASSIKGGSSGRGGGPFSSSAGGGLLYPRGSSLKDLAHQEASLANRVCSWNEALNSDAIAYASAVLSESVSVLSSGHGAVEQNQLIDEILPSLASSLCFQTPSTPVLSGCTAIALLPLLTQCATLLDRYVQSKELTASSLNEMEPGKWVIRTASSGTKALEKDVDEYVVSLKQVSTGNSTDFGVHGMGIGTTGRFKNGHVTITGSVRGSSLTFVEDWQNGGSLSLPTLSRTRSPSSCVVEARLSADGARFEGTYRNIRFDTSGKIAGAYHDPTQRMFSRSNSLAVRTVTLLTHAASRLAANLSLGTSLEDLREKTFEGGQDPDKLVLELLASSNLLSRGKAGFDIEDVGLVRDMYRPYLANCDCIDASKKWQDDALAPLLEKLSSISRETDAASHRRIDGAQDARVAVATGGFGSLSVLDREAYQTSRLDIVSVFLHHTDLYDTIVPKLIDPDADIPADAIPLWKKALQIMEAGVRSAIASQKAGSTRKEKCQAYCRLSSTISNFLLGLPSAAESGVFSSARDAILLDIENIYQTIQNEVHLRGLERQMGFMTLCGIARCVSLSCISMLLSEIQTVAAIEAIAVSFPRVSNGEKGATEKKGTPRQNSSALAGVSATLGTKPNTHAAGFMPGIGTHYLTSLHGCSSDVQDLVSVCVQDVYTTFGNILHNKVVSSKDAELGTSTSTQSLALSILSSFLTALKPSDFDSFVIKSKLVESLSSILSQYRSSISSTNVSAIQQRDKRADSSLSVMKNLLESANSFSLKQVSRSALSVIHALAYQVTSWSSSADGHVEDISYILELLCTHFREVLRALSNVELDHHTKKTCKRAEADWQIWMKNRSPEDSSFGEEMTTNAAGESKDDGLDGFAWAQCMLETGSICQQAKMEHASSKPLSSASVFQSSIFHQAQSCLNAMYTTTKSGDFVQAIGSNPTWVTLLLEASGLSSRSIAAVPLRLRTRIVRLLMRILPSTTPDESLILSCFQRLGQFLCVLSSADMPTSCSVIAQENAASAVNSLLRCLYSTEAYRTVVNKVMINEISSKNDDIAMETGLLSFLGGLPGRVSEGSFVLLKPSTASALSSSSTALNKTSGSGSAAAVGSAPIVIGSEAVVTGLCRQDAMGGMVSAIDPSNGTCEVVVFDRSADASSNHSSGMTVRAVRAQLPDVVSAEEVPVLFGDELDVGVLIGASLNEAVDCLLSSTSDRGEVKENEEESGGEKESDSYDVLDSVGSSDEIGFLTRSILSIRASTIALSDKQAMLRFIESSDLSSRNILSKMLELASSTQRRCSYETANAAFRESISSTPEHEARYLHLRRMLAEAMARQATFKSKSIVDWEELIRSFRYPCRLCRGRSW